MSRSTFYPEAIKTVMDMPGQASVFSIALP